MLHAPRKRAYFVEVPRTASTAAAYFLRGRGWKADKGENRHRFPELDHTPLVGVIRNPWSRIGSIWRGWARNNYDDIEAMLRDGRGYTRRSPILTTPQSAWLPPHATVLRFESLVEDWQACPLLPKLRGSMPGKNRSPVIQERWSPWAVDYVKEHFSQDIDRMGYTAPVLTEG